MFQNSCNLFIKNLGAYIIYVKANISKSKLQFWFTVNFDLLLFSLATACGKCHLSSRTIAIFVFATLQISLLWNQGSSYWTARVGALCELCFSSYYPWTIFAGACYDYCMLHSEKYWLTAFDFWREQTNKSNLPINCLLYQTKFFAIVAWQSNNKMPPSGRQNCAV